MLLNAKQAAELLGVHESTVFKYAKRGMPCIRIGGSIRFQATEIRAWYDSNKVRKGRKWKIPW